MRRSSVLPSSSISALVLGDFNGDGTVDLLAASDNEATESEWFSAITQTSQAIATNVSLPGNGPSKSSPPTPEMRHT
jgi:hypothetical protein